MRIIHFVGKYGTTPETFITQFVKKSRSFGETKILCFENSSNSESGMSILPNLVYSGSKPGEFLFWATEKLLSFKFWERSFLKILKSFKPEIIHVHFGTIAVLLLELLNRREIEIPIVVSFYGFDASSLPKNDVDYANNIGELFKSSNLFAFGEGPSLCEKIQAMGIDKSKILVNPLIVGMVNPKESTTFKNSNTINFLMVGRFVEKKGFHLALQALGEIKAFVGPFKLSIIGYGDMQSVYDEIIEKYELSDNVKFLGMKSHLDVLQSLNDHDFFLHPSLTATNGDSEGGAPTIIIEAQEAGIPVIASDHADIPYVMGYSDFLANEGDLKSIKEKILSAVKTPKKRLKELIEIGRNHIAKQHSFSHSNTYESNMQQVIRQFESQRNS